MNKLFYSTVCQINAIIIITSLHVFEINRTNLCSDISNLPKLSEKLFLMHGDINNIFMIFQKLIQ